MFMIASEWLQPVCDEIADKTKPEKERQDAELDGEASSPSTSIASCRRSRPRIGPCKRWNASTSTIRLGRMRTRRCSCSAAFTSSGENFKDSARYFQQLAETYDRSPLRDEALKLAIIATNNSTGGPRLRRQGCGRGHAADQLGQGDQPGSSREQGGKFLDEQALIVRYQQAQKDYETAEFYRRTGHPGSAWFYYELVRRRYPGIKPYADYADARQKELKSELDEMKNPSVWGTTRRIWKEYVLGEEIPKVKDPAGPPDPKDLPKTLPEPRPVLPKPGSMPSQSMPN